MLYLYLLQVVEVTSCHCLVPVSQGDQWHRGPPAPTEAGSSMDHGSPPARVGGLASPSSGLEFTPCRKSEVNTFYIHTRGVACVATISHICYMSYTRPDHSPAVISGPETRKQQASSQSSLKTPPIHPVGRFARGVQESRTPQGPTPAQKPLSDSRSR
ncbi:unnamed protein product [Timema podura]|uniref:Uncharacterized protein n=1 Tax=Timema podura TaxID=61482 RepID=A0ABN7PQJ3_TIMPD|nr:unnamed protein product [Timema podura]